MANQAYTFNGTTPNANVSYAPGTFNMGASFNMYQVPYSQQQNQSYTQNQQYHNNSVTEQSSKTPQQDTTAIIEQLQQLLLPQKNSVHQVNEVKATMPQCKVICITFTFSPVRKTTRIIQSCNCIHRL